MGLVSESNFMAYSISQCIFFTECLADIDVIENHRDLPESLLLIQWYKIDISFLTCH
jgi:hypothetical protein